MNRKTKVLYKFWWSLVIVVFSVSLAASLLSWYRKRNVKRTWQAMIRDRQAQLAKLRFPLTTKTLFALRREYDWLNEKNTEVWEQLEEKRLVWDEPKPLEFKEKLLNAQLKFRQLADIQGAVIPADLGFPQYARGEIPRKKDIPLLNQQLFIVNEVVNLLLKHKVEKILAIYCQPEMETGEGNLYRELKFKITVQCLVRELIEILTALANTPFITTVNDISLEKVDDNRVVAVLNLAVIEFNNDQQPQQ